MSRNIKQPVKSMQEERRHWLISMAAAITVILLPLIIASAILYAPEKEFSAVLSPAAGTAENITINPHPYYNVKISADGQTYSVKTTGTVGDAIKDAGLYLGEDDLINVAPGEPLNRSTNIVINRVEYVEEVKLETIDYATQYKHDDNYLVGYKKVVVDGEEGELETVLRHTYIDGKFAGSSVVSTEVTEEPVDEVIVMGTAEVNPIEAMSISQLSVPDWLALDENGVPTSYTNVLTGKSCAYSAKPTAKTASGRQVKVGHVAVNPNIIPYGTELYIASTDGKYIYGYAIAADTGTALMDNLILVDLFMESYEASCKWGAKQVNIYILN